MEANCFSIVVASRQKFLFIIHVFILSSGMLSSNSQAPPVAASADGTANDKLALLSFKSFISEDPYGALESWNSSSIDICRWQGVGCSTISANVSSLQQRVTSLTLDSKDLAGQIHPSLSNISFLTSLNLGGNRLHGTIPSELGMLSQLRRLKLSSNSLDGQIPPSLANCTSLEYVDLWRNRLEGEIPKELFTGHHGLQGFRASANNLTGAIPPEFGNMTPLTSLSLSDNSLRGRIPIEIGQLFRLVFLDLSLNSLSGNIPYSLYNLSNLEILGVANNHLTGTIPSSLGGVLLPKIRLLSMYTNKLEGLIPPSLGNASNILRLDLSLNKLRGSIPSNIGSSMRSVTHLQLGGNQLLEAGDWSFLSSLVNCTQLQYLNLAGNNLQGAMPDSIGNLSRQLQGIHLQRNQIAGLVPSSIGHLNGLRMLNLERNYLSGVIPESMGMLNELLRLHMKSNDLHGEIPLSLSNLSLLTNLDLSSNKLVGSISMSLIKGMRSLQYLDLSYNNLTSVVIQFPSSLISADLSYNFLTGSIPSNLSVMATNLNLLNLSYNSLLGEIPPDALAGFHVLQELRLEHNSFEGFIPTSLAKLRGLQVLDISSNKFTGSIPLDLGKLALNYLNLSYNNLQGPVPKLGIFNTLTLSSIEGNNALCGSTRTLHLPDCSPKLLNHRNNMKKEMTWIAPISIITIICICIFGWLLHTSRDSTINTTRSDGGSVVPMLSGNHRSEDNMFATIGGSCRSIRTQINPLTREKTRRVWEGPLRVSYMDIFRTTCGFSRENLLKSCGFGSVYKGTLSIVDDGFVDDNKMDVAVKVLHLERKGADKSFESECYVLRGIRHHNLVPVLTCCVGIDNEGNDFKAIVYEFMPNGSLDDWLHPKLNDLDVGRKRNLGLEKRLDIAIDVASALEYLHLHCQTPIVHCDIKPSNVLLDQDMTARVGDFGLARLRPILLDYSNSSVNSTIGLKGSYGYIAPEYSWSNEVSTLGDIYSFGILLLEMFTGRKPTTDFFIDDINLHTYVEVAYKQDILNVVDPNLCLMEENGKREWSTNTQRISASSRVHECLKLVFLVGLLCSKEDPKNRLGIEDARKALNDARANYANAHT